MKAISQSVQCKLRKNGMGKNKNVIGKIDRSEKEKRFDKCGLKPINYAQKPKF